MAAYEEDINLRREKLRSLILVEEAALTREIVEQFQRGTDTRLDEIKRKEDEERKKEEENHKAIVAVKRMQQYFAQCPDARERHSKRTAKDVKYSNVVQMAENEAKRQAEKELDALWHELMLKEVEAKKFRETEDERKRFASSKSILADLDKQVAGKRALEAEERQIRKDQEEYLALLWENIRKEELNNLKKENRRRESLKKELEEQMIMTKRRLAERAREEAAMDQMSKNLADAELAKERALIRDNASALRRELLAYMKHLEDIRQEEARRNKEVEEIVEQSRKDAEARRGLATRKFKEARARGLQEVLKGREQQLKEKKEAMEREKRLLEDEKQSLEKELELEEKMVALEKKERRQRAVKYGEVLKAQQRYREELHRCEKEEDQRMYRQGLEREEECRRLTEELLNAPEVITPHPFKLLLKECSSRREAEQSNRCYCPPPLAADFS